jgi:hypothetical protein
MRCLMKATTLERSLPQMKSTMHIPQLSGANPASPPAAPAAIAMGRLACPSGFRDIDGRNARHSTLHRVDFGARYTFRGLAIRWRRTCVPR